MVDGTRAARVIQPISQRQTQEIVEAIHRIVPHVLATALVLIRDDGPHGGPHTELLLSAPEAAQDAVVTVAMETLRSRQDGDCTIAQSFDLSLHDPRVSHEN